MPSILVRQTGSSSASTGNSEFSCTSLKFATLTNLSIKSASLEKIILHRLLQASQGLQGRGHGAVLVGREMHILYELG